ncbi:MAG: cytochrome c biogenesis CcdA family protein [Candidatus Hydrothermarchaeales archaeon]
MEIAQPSMILAFLAGVVTIATPCIIPILPPMLAGSVGHKLRPLFIVLGSVVTFTLMGGLFSVIGIAVGFTGNLIRQFFIFFIIGFGIIMVSDEINEIYTKYSSMFVDRLVNVFKKGEGISDEGHPLLSAFVLGLSLGIVWIPCVGPILGFVLLFTTIQGNIVRGSLLLAVYSIGLGIPMLSIAYGGKYVSGKVEWTKRNSETIRFIAGWILILTGVAMFLGFDRLIQTRLLPYFPNFELSILAKF